MIRASGARGPGFNSRPSPSNPFVFFKKKRETKIIWLEQKWSKELGVVGDWTRGLLNANQTLYHWATTPNTKLGGSKKSIWFISRFFFSKLQVNKIGDSSKGFRLFFSLSNLKASFLIWLCGATVARPTPDRKAACSNHVRVKCNFFSFTFSSLTQPKLEVRRIKFR